MECSQSKHHGFNLIELMIAVAIISIIASIAIPAYQASRARSIISGEVLPILKKMSGDLTEYYLSQGSLSGFCSDYEANNPVSTQYIHSIECSPKSGSKPVRLSARLKTSQMPDVFPNTPRVMFFPTLDDNGTMLWHCGYLSRADQRIPSKFLPKPCRSNYVHGWNFRIYINGVNRTGKGIPVDP